MNQPPSPPYTINLPTSDPNLTYDALMNTIHYLYTPTLIPKFLPDTSTIISHMASCSVLGIYPSKLVDCYRSILLNSNLTPQSILPFISFLLSSPHPLDPAAAHPGPYPPFTTGLLSNVITHFLNTLPLQLQSSAIALPPSANTEEYRAILVPLPFELLKCILEHPNLPIASEKQRYELAKTIVAKRAAKEKHVRRRTESGGGMPPPVEESVILKVGGRDGGGVQIVRSFSRRRGLWKAQPNGRSRNSISGSK